MWFWRMIHHQGWIRYPSEISIYRKDLWEDLECETLDHGKIRNPLKKGLASFSRMEFWKM
jgi:hypothetical protein